MSHPKDPAMPDHAEPAPAHFDLRDFRDALGTFATGVTIVTARGRDSGPVGLTVNSFASVSLEPPLVLWSQSLYAQSLAAFQEASHFVVNVLAADQIELAKRFAGAHDDRFLDVAHIVPDHGAPVITGCAAHFECRNEARYYGGDHIIFLGRVERYAFTPKPTLMFCRGQFLGWKE
jgi:flavin reductase (DIM6/NTAB) family NADH-FMN oxidoreductase RutF